MFFKVTTSENKSLYGDDYPKFSVQYSTEYFARPKIGKLYCYNLQCVKVDCVTDKAYLPEYALTATRKLWVCECHNPVFSDSTLVFELEQVQRCLSKRVLPTYSSREAYSITAVTASAIKLIREISCEELNELYTEYKKGL